MPGTTLLTHSLLAVVWHVPLIWVIGGLLLLAGILDVFRGRTLRGIVLAIIGVLLGALNLTVFL
jgi:hypothetical protein